MHQVYKTLLNKNGLPYTAELYAPPIRESVLKEYDLPHTVAVCTLRTRNLLNEYDLPHTVADGMYVANTKVY